MNKIKVRETTGQDGILHLQIPMEQPNTEYEVTVVVRPANGHAETTEELGWPPGYFEATFGSITDETFVRHPQGELPPPVAEFD